MVFNVDCNTLVVVEFVLFDVKLFVRYFWFHFDFFSTVLICFWSWINKTYYVYYNIDSLHWLCHILQCGLDHVGCVVVMGL